MLDLRLVRARKVAMAADASHAGTRLADVPVDARAGLELDKSAGVGEDVQCTAEPIGT